MDRDVIAQEVATRGAGSCVVTKGFVAVAAAAAATVARRPPCAWLAFNLCCLLVRQIPWAPGARAGTEVKLHRLSASPLRFLSFVHRFLSPSPLLNSSHLSPRQELRIRVVQPNLDPALTLHLARDGL